MGELQVLWSHLQEKSINLTAEVIYSKNTDKTTEMAFLCKSYC